MSLTNCCGNMVLKDAVSEGSDGNEEHVIGNWTKCNFCYKVSKTLAELFPSILWEVELENNENGNLTEEISKQNIEGMA